MTTEDANLLFYTLCNELWKLKLIGKVNSDKGRAVESVQFQFPTSFIDTTQYASVQYNQVSKDDIGKVILRFYIKPLETTNTYDFVAGRYFLRREGRTRIEEFNKKDLAKYAGYGNDDYLEFEFTQFDSSHTQLKDIRLFFFKLSNYFPTKPDYLLLHLDEKIRKLPKTY